MSATSEHAIQTLLEQTEAAHGEYESRELGGATDEAWAAWYAAYLIDHGFAALVGDRSITAEGLGSTLTALDEAYRREQPATTWAAYYAARLTERHPEDR